MNCINPDCTVDFPAVDCAEIGGHLDTLEIVVTCPECGQGHYTSLKAEELILDESRPAKGGVKFLTHEAA